ncbi:MAG: amidase domain-containing protein [Oscillospiraceae bacterium]
MEFNRAQAVAYAHEWWDKRNPAYFDFEELGGDCTNFVSQCLYAGAGVMNFTPVLGWYYIDLNNRSASWSAAEYLYNFITTNGGASLYGEEQGLSAAIPGDVVQLSFDGVRFTHSALVTMVRRGEVFVTSHSYDRLDKPTGGYPYKMLRVIHILGVRG